MRENVQAIQLFPISLIIFVWRYDLEVLVESLQGTGFPVILLSICIAKFHLVLT